MVIRIVISGERHCKLFAQACLVADYLQQNLPNFCFERIEKSVVEWPSWLSKTNTKNKWHHCASPLIWKELLMKGSKPYYIGSFADFLDYCYSYYQFDTYFSQSKFDKLVANTEQLKLKNEREPKRDSPLASALEDKISLLKTRFSVGISGCSHPLTLHIISNLLEIDVENKSIAKIYIYDEECSASYMHSLENECSYIFNNNPNKVVKHVEKLGSALKSVDMLIVLNHVPFDYNYSIGEWLNLNKDALFHVSQVINASASPTLKIVLPNLGPACYNATVLKQLVKNECRTNIVVATSDLGLEIISTAAELAEVPSKSMFCPPVWGFVGINHYVDIRKTYHRYNYFEPYPRALKVRNSTLTIGNLVPEIRSMEYLMYNCEDQMWTMVSNKQKTPKFDFISPINKSIAVANIVRLWLFEKNTANITSLGIPCDGSFDTDFEGFLSQPAHLENGTWKPVKNYPRPKDKYVGLSHLIDIAKLTMTLDKNALPNPIPYCRYRCSKPKIPVNKRGIRLSYTDN